MNEYIKIAWRNLRRNKRRSLITISSVLFATFFAIVMRSLQFGSYDAMINTMVEMFSGYIQIEHKDMPDEKSIENLIEYSPEIISKIKSVENVKTVVPRLTSFAFASSGNQSKGAMLSGIDPELENSMTKIKDQIAKIKITKKGIEKLKKQGLPEDIINKLMAAKNQYFAREEILKFELELSDEEFEKYLSLIKKECLYPGKFLSQKDKGVLIGAGLAKYLKIETGDTLVLLGQGYHGVSAGGKFPVRGVLKIPNPKLNALAVYSSLSKVQEFYSAYDVSETGQDSTLLLSNYAVNINKKSDAEIFKTRDLIIAKINNKEFLIRGWKQANKQLANQIKADNESGKMMVWVLYIVIGFGIFGTVLMMIAERKREMGVMIAIGMKKTKLAIIVTLELIFINFIGVILGIILSSPIIIIGHLNPLRFKGEIAEMLANYGMEPVMPFAWFDTYILNQILVVLIISLIVMIFPIIKIARLKVIDALRA